MAENIFPKVGKVGIGTKSPARELHIRDFVDGGLQIQNDNTDAGVSRIELGSRVDQNCGTIMWYEKAQRLQLFATCNGKGSGSIHLIPGAEGGNVVVAQGNVGIGTASPEANLHVHGNLPLLLTRENGVPYMRFRGGPKQTDVAAIAFDGSLLHVQNGSGGPLGNIALNGNVGIGTTSPFQQLHVGNNGRLQMDNGGVIQFRNSTDTDEALQIHMSGDVGVINMARATHLALAINTGNVGIGTTSPEEKLHVSGGDILLDNKQCYRIKNSAGVAYIVARLDASNNLTLGTDIQGDASIAAGGTTRLTIKSDGAVGIGTPTPRAKLHLYEAKEKTTVGLLMGNKTTGGEGDYKGFLIDYHEVGGAELWNFQNTDMWFGTDDTRRMTITAGGDVKIDKGLDVGGDVKIEGKLNIRNWELSSVPDDVFDDDYQLMQLSTLDRYVKEKRHLPDIPSGEDMKKDGVDVGELCMSLLRKVEELSLHILSQNKRINQLEANPNLPE